MHGLLSRWLAHPLTRGLSVDDPRTTALRRRIVREKPFLKALYSEWYRRLLALMPSQGRVLEIGSGAGFLKEFRNDIISSEVFATEGVDLIADGRCLPFRQGSLDCVVMTDVFHHIPDIAGFLDEAARCVRPGGRLAMIEPWRTPWSEWVYKNLHHEPFEPDSNWLIPDSGPLSGANGALPWIVFARDRARFAADFPEWKLMAIEPMMPLTYIFSGGVSMRSLAPGWSYPLFRRLEAVVGETRWAMFALIELERR